MPSFKISQKNIMLTTLLPCNLFLFYQLLVKTVQFSSVVPNFHTIKIMLPFFWAVGS